MNFLSHSQYRKAMTQQPSGREMADIAVERGAIDMAQGVVHTPPPGIFFDVLARLFKERRMHVYASPAGYKGYREALLALLTEERPHLALESIMSTNGVTGGLVSALRTVCSPGDHVVLLEPFYPAHDWAISSLYAVARYVPYTHDFSVDLAAIKAALPGARAFVLGNPANPTGVVLSQDELEEIYRLCQQENVLLIVDEVYKDFIWDGSFASLLSLVNDFEHLVILRSFSKNLALAGWRAGYAVTTPERIKQMVFVHEAFYVGAPAAPQIVLAELLTKHRNDLGRFIDDTHSLYHENRIRIIEALSAYGMEPHPKQGAYYMMVKHNRASDIAAMQELLDKGIAVAPGVPFYRPGTKETGYLRAHFALSQEDCQRVVDILQQIP